MTRPGEEPPSTPARRHAVDLHLPESSPSPAVLLLKKYLEKHPKSEPPAQSSSTSSLQQQSTGSPQLRRAQSVGRPKARTLHLLMRSRSHKEIRSQQGVATRDFWYETLDGPARTLPASHTLTASPTVSSSLRTVEKPQGSDMVRSNSPPFAPMNTPEISSGDVTPEISSGTRHRSKGKQRAEEPPEDDQDRRDSTREPAVANNRSTQRSVSPSEQPEDDQDRRNSTPQSAVGNRRGSRLHRERSTQGPASTSSEQSEDDQDRRNSTQQPAVRNPRGSWIHRERSAQRSASPSSEQPENEKDTRNSTQQPSVENRRGSRLHKERSVQRSDSIPSEQQGGSDHSTRVERHTSRIHEPKAASSNSLKTVVEPIQRTTALTLNHGEEEQQFECTHEFIAAVALESDIASTSPIELSPPTAPLSGPDELAPPTAPLHGPDELSHTPVAPLAGPAELSRASVAHLPDSDEVDTSNMPIEPPRQLAPLLPDPDDVDTPSPPPIVPYVRTVPDRAKRWSAYDDDEDFVEMPGTQGPEGTVPDRDGASSPYNDDEDSMEMPGTDYPYRLIGSRFVAEAQPPGRPNRVLPPGSSTPVRISPDSQRNQALGHRRGHRRTSAISQSRASALIQPQVYTFIQSAFRRNAEVRHRELERERIRASVRGEPISRDGFDGGVERIENVDQSTAEHVEHVPQSEVAAEVPGVTFYDHSERRNRGPLAGETASRGDSDQIENVDEDMASSATYLEQARNSIQAVSGRNLTPPNISHGEGESIEVSRQDNTSSGVIYLDIVRRSRLTGPPEVRATTPHGEAESVADFFEGEADFIENINPLNALEYRQQAEDVQNRLLNEAQRESEIDRHAILCRIHREDINLTPRTLRRTSAAEGAGEMPTIHEGSTPAVADLVPDYPEDLDESFREDLYEGFPALQRVHSQSG